MRYRLTSNLLCLIFCLSVMSGVVTKFSYDRCMQVVRRKGYVTSLRLLLGFLITKGPQDRCNAPIVKKWLVQMYPMDPFCCCPWMQLRHWTKKNKGGEMIILSHSDDFFPWFVNWMNKVQETFINTELKNKENYQ